MDFNIILDLACEVGKTSKLLKVLKNSGFSPRLISYDSIRLRINYNLKTEGLGKVLSDILNISTLLKNLRDLWVVVCIETWVEELNGGKIVSGMYRVGDVCVSVRRGRGNRVVKKLVLADQCRSIVRGLIPESLTRKCLESQENLDSVFSQIRSFIYELCAVKTHC